MIYNKNKLSWVCPACGGTNYVAVPKGGKIKDVCYYCFSKFDLEYAASDLAYIVVGIKEDTTEI